MHSKYLQQLAQNILQYRDYLWDLLVDGAACRIFATNCMEYSSLRYKCTCIMYITYCEVSVSLRITHNKKERKQLKMKSRWVE